MLLRSANTDTMRDLQHQDLSLAMNVSSFRNLPIAMMDNEVVDLDIE